jgi:hypothetical protein
MVEQAIIVFDVFGLFILNMILGAGSMVENASAE